MDILFTAITEQFEVDFHEHDVITILYQVDCILVIFSLTVRFSCLMVIISVIGIQFPIHLLELLFDLMGQESIIGLLASSFGFIGALGHI